MSESLQNTYRSSNETVRASFGGDSAKALDYYRTLIEFVVGVSPGQGCSGAQRLLDVGCGTGWSTFSFAESGYDAVGIDLNPAAFEPPAHERMRLLEGSATEIPLPAESFDVVTCYQCLEHIPTPEKALSEMIRMCRPGGVVVVVGPNLVSPTPGLAFLAKPSHWRSMRFRRQPEDPRHPYGNTVPEIFGVALLRSIQLLGKLLRRAPEFTMREPDHRPPFHADSDACYLCNPTDLISYFRSLGFHIDRCGKPGRPPFTYLLAGGTWVAARKPERE